MRRLVAGDYAVDAVTMAKALVGAWLCRRLEDGTVIRRRITETEAYCGEKDSACHAHKGRTARTDVMYWHRLRLQARPKPQVALYAPFRRAKLGAESFLDGINRIEKGASA